MNSQITSLSSDWVNSELLLRKSKFLLEQHNARPSQCIVMGNSAADSDSFVCSLVYALTRKDAVPIIRIKRNDFHIRKEILLIMNNTGINPDSLLSISDIDRTSLQSNQNQEFALVDHNSLDPEFSGRVIAIVDHHDDLGRHLNADPRVINTEAASCASVLCTKILTEVPREPLDRLLLYAVLLDSKCLTHKHKTRPMDHESIGKLLKMNVSIVASAIPQWATSQMDELMSAEKSIDHLSLSEILKRNYKEVTTSSGMKIGIPGNMPKNKKWNLYSNNVEEDIKAFIEEKGVDVVVFMGHFDNKSGKAKRQLSISYRAGVKADCKAHQFLEHANLELESSEALWGQSISWDHKTSRCNRKMIAPLLLQAFSQIRSAP